jgi:hypothetical protein
MNFKSSLLGLLLVSGMSSAASLPGVDTWCGYGDTCNGANNWFGPMWGFNYAINVPSDSPVKGYIAQPRVCVRNGAYYGPTVYMGANGQVIDPFSNGRCPRGTVAFPDIRLRNTWGQPLNFWVEQYHWAWEYCGYGMSTVTCVDAGGALGDAQE